MGVNFDIFYHPDVAEKNIPKFSYLYQNKKVYPFQFKLRCE